MQRIQCLRENPISVEGITKADKKEGFNWIQSMLNYLIWDYQEVFISYS